MSNLKRRYQVGYAMRCGNTWNDGEPYSTLSLAQDYVEYKQQRHNARTYFITDLDDPERGDLMGVDAEEYEERYAE